MTPQSPITASSVAYARRGDLARRIDRSSVNAPSASPPKNPATAPRTAIISVPSARLKTRVHTISYPSPSKPDATTIGMSFQLELPDGRSAAGRVVSAQAAGECFIWPHRAAGYMQPWLHPFIEDPLRELA